MKGCNSCWFFIWSFLCAPVEGHGSGSESLAQGHTASEGQNWDSNPHHVISKLRLLPPH